LRRISFTRDGRNVNYCRLPEDIQAVILEPFAHEMGMLKPTHFIAMGLEVAKTLHVLKDEGKITADTGLRLRHPRWCGIDWNYDAGLQEYIDVLGRFIKPAAKGQGG
jgi:hypothetical protein